MGYPTWVTPSGDLGKIAELEYYQFSVVATEATGQPVTFSLIAGRMPPGIQLSSSGTISGQPAESFISLTGTPAAVNQDRDFKFTIRATANNNPLMVSDRTFTITVGGNREPTILTPGVDLGTYLDGVAIDIALEAVDLDGDPLIWRLKDGELPEGTVLNSDGTITGVIRPKINLPEGAQPGWDRSRWESYPWEFSTRSVNKTYQFVAEVTDGKSFVSKSYSLLVISHDSLRADNTFLTSDTRFITADADEKRPPVLLTDSLGIYATYKSDNYFAFKFDAIDLDGDDVSYTILIGGGIGFDAPGSNFDAALFDRGSFLLPPGLTLQTSTGWLTGYIPAQVESSKQYTFAIQAYKTNNPNYITDLRFFTLTILGSLDLTVTWLTPNNLGSISAGEVSNLQVSAVSAVGQNLSYKLKNGSRIPQGLRLLSDGLLSGRCSFQTFSVDSGTTTFDKNLAEKGFTTGQTVFDRTYRFTVVVTNADNSISSERTFEVKVDTVTAQPYENVYFKCLPELEARDKLLSIIENTDVFPNDSIYRLNDPYWGKNREISVLAAYGLTASSAEDYIAAMESRHYNKKLYFGRYGTSVAKDENDNIEYEVIWVDIIEDTRSYIKGIKQGPPASTTDLRTKINNWRNPNYDVGDPVGYTLRTNDELLMRRDLVEALGRTSPTALPAWMTSVQKDKTVLGFTTKAVLAYVRPGEGEKILFRLNRATNSKILPDIKEIPFVADRYVLDNNLTQYFNTETDLWEVHRYTTFDTEVRIDENLTPVATVDFAVDIPFEYINGRTIAEVEALGGLDNIITSFVGKTLVFATQENYFGFSYDLSNQGWVKYGTFYDDATKFDNVGFDISTIIPGFVESEANPSIANQRSGIWRIEKDSNDLIRLVFVETINQNEIVEVRFGTRYGGNKLVYLYNTDDTLATVPTFMIIDPGTVVEAAPTTFDSNTTRFLNAVDIYSQPYEGDKYLKFPKIGVFS